MVPFACIEGSIELSQRRTNAVRQIRRCSRQKPIPRWERTERYQNELPLQYDRKPSTQQSDAGSRNRLCFSQRDCRMSGKPSVIADQPIPVQLRAPNRLHESASVSASGSVEANVTALTAFQIGGRVARVNVEEGQFVKQGQELADLDCSDYRNAFEAAIGQATAADANALQARNGVRAQELEQARVDFERVEDEYQRNKYLYDHQSLPANDFHKIEAAYLTSQQRYDMAREGSRSEEKKATEGQAHAAIGNLSEARKHVGDCQLKAPISGFVGMKKIDVGDTVSAGNPVFSVLDLDPVKVRVGIPEAEIGKVHEGARALVTIPSLDNRQFEGKVEAVGLFG